MMNLTIEQVIEYSENFKIDEDSKSYLISYPEFLNYFSSVNKIEKHHLIIAANFVYGWMPTIFKFKNEISKDLIESLNEAKIGTELEFEDLNRLKKLLNNSIVGTSKLLHFINPEKFPIWDSTIAQCFGIKNGVNSINHYLSYINFCCLMIKNEKFESISKKVKMELDNYLEKNIIKNYSVSDVRILDLVLFEKGKEKSKNNKSTEKNNL